MSQSTLSRQQSFHERDEDEDPEIQRLRQMLEEKEQLRDAGMWHFFFARLMCCGFWHSFTFAAKQKKRQLEEEGLTNIYQPSQQGSYALVTQVGLKEMGSDSADFGEPSVKRNRKAAKSALESELTPEDKEVFNLASRRLWYDHCLLNNPFPDAETAKTLIYQLWVAAQNDLRKFGTDIQTPEGVGIFKLVSHAPCFISRLE